ncbi:MAG: M14 family zinc carboxypeptidase [Candidatus Brocadiia bacterium]
MRAYRGAAALAAVLLGPSLAAWAGEEAGEPKTFKIEVLRGGALVVGIAERGQAGVGDCYEVRREGRLVGYARVHEMAGDWPKIEFLLGSGRRDDELVPLAPPFPTVQLLTDEPEGRETKELKALCGEKLRIVPIAVGEPMTVPSPDEVLVALIHGGAPFMMGDPIVMPHARGGGLLLCDSLLYAQLQGAVADQAQLREPPTIRIIHESPLTRGLSLEDRIPWYGRQGKRYVARYLPKVLAEAGGESIAVDSSGEKIAMLEDKTPGRVLVFDFVSVTGRAGRDPGAKNKWVLAARAMGTGPRYARYFPHKPDLASIDGWFQAFYEDHTETVRKKLEGGGSERESFVYSFGFGPTDKPLVLLVACVEGNAGEQWLGAVSLLAVAEILVDNPRRDPAVKALLQRFRFKLIPVLNRHGYRNDVAANANKVELNRNFPYRWADQRADAPRGSEPFSEIESGLLRRIVEEEKPAAFVEIQVDDYEAGYRMAHAVETPERDQAFLGTVRTLVNTRLRHRFVVDGDQMLQLALAPAEPQASALNWLGSTGALALRVGICGDGEDSLTNTDVAIETALQLLHALALRTAPAPAEAEQAPGE